MRSFLLYKISVIEVIDAHFYAYFWVEVIAFNFNNDVLCANNIEVFKNCVEADPSYHMENFRIIVSNH
jgi:hypothetical protein